MSRICITILWMVFISGCGPHEEKLIVRVDLSHERDEGRFIPESGDHITLAGEFSNWQPAEFNLVDENGDWIYEVALPRTLFSSSDSFSFKFVIVSRENRDLPNSGWEVIPNRHITAEELQKEEPVFIFNEVWSPLVKKELAFRVNLSNQQVLGFFNPQAGDKAAVTGSFNAWQEGGIILEQQDSLVYGLTFPVEVKNHEPLIYKYIIIPGEERKEGFAMPNNGWEITDNRLYRKEPITDYFNNQKRVLRVVITEDWIAKKTNLEQDDVLHLKLMWNGSQSRNYRLEPNGNGAYETALQIPESAADINAQVLINYEQHLYSFDEIKVNVDGKYLQLTL